MIHKHGNKHLRREKRRIRRRGENAILRHRQKWGYRFRNQMRWSARSQRAKRKGISLLALLYKEIRRK